MPPSITYPGVYVEEMQGRGRTITRQATSITAFVGRTALRPLGADAQPDAGATANANVDVARSIRSFADFERDFGPLDVAYPMGHAVRDFFANGGTEAVIVRVCGAHGAGLEDADYFGEADPGTGLHALGRLESFNLLCIPPDVRDGSVSPMVLQAALALCVACRAMLIVDAPAEWDSVASIVRDDAAALATLGIEGTPARNAALYFPRLLQADPAGDAPLLAFAACGAIAGLIARTDATRGVWKAPAGIEATFQGAPGLEVELDDAENGLLNPYAVNGLRRFPFAGTTVWGARTMAGRDAMGDDDKYVPVRRLALHIEDSVLRGTRWAAFEPNAEPLWAMLRRDIDAFMHGLFREGAFQGSTPREAWYVRCDGSTTTQHDIDLGIVDIEIGFAPTRPAEFVLIRLSVAAGSTAGA